MGWEPTPARASRATVPHFRVGSPQAWTSEAGPHPRRVSPEDADTEALDARAEKVAWHSRRGFGAGSAGQLQCTGNASRERKRTVRCVSHRAGTERRTSAARVTHACMTPMHAEGIAATDRDILAPLFPPARAPSGAWRGGSANLFKFPRLFFLAFCRWLVAGLFAVAHGLGAYAGARVARHRAPFSSRLPPSVDQRSGATPSQSIPRRRGHGGFRRARGKGCVAQSQGFRRRKCRAASVHRERVTGAEAHGQMRFAQSWH